MNRDITRFVERGPSTSIGVDTTTADSLVSGSEAKLDHLSTLGRHKVDDLLSQDFERLNAKGHRGIIIHKVTGAV